jgi:hypothetical protein
MVVAAATVATIEMNAGAETVVAIAAMTVAPAAAQIVAPNFDLRSNFDRSSIPDSDSPFAVSMIQVLYQAYD